MKIQHIRINNILGIDELELTPEGFTEISGRNGEGKTSVLEAIKSVIQDGGHDATLLRRGAEKGEVVLVLDDGTQLTRRFTEKSSPRLMEQEGVKVKKPAESIRKLTDMLSVNPVDFLRAPKKDRVRVLLEAMPLDADVERLTEITGIPVHNDEGAHALEVIETVRKQVYDDRTGTNRAVREKEATINQLRSAMPDAPKGGVDGSEDELSAKLEDARSTKDAELQRISTKLDGIRSEHHQKVGDIRQKAQEEIDRIKASAAAEVEKLQTELAEWEQKASTQRERKTAAFHEIEAPIQQSLASIRQNRTAASKRAQALATIEQMEADLEELQGDSKHQTEALKELDTYKNSLLSSLPIPGLEVIDGEVFREGVAFDRLNTAQQVDIAVEIAKLRAGDLRVCCVDGIELLDSGAFEEFKQRSAESGLQLFVSRVSDENFTVKTS